MRPRFDSGRRPTEPKNVQCLRSCRELYTQSVSLRRGKDCGTNGTLCVLSLKTMKSQRLTHEVHQSTEKIGREAIEKCQLCLLLNNSVRLPVRSAGCRRY
ncbi:hypothetical protein ElyMa_003342000 [Elysia marginata]|uniref:Uncharacterized protein n=1 Tax=Elysia marginata TaxID=1093978 RepID=A0AAV4JFF0_9GAST|nr:hypothetical protein ElyMa_003342000 [Elysia marginata]